MPTPASGTSAAQALTIVLVGLSGSGKTSLAIRFAHSFFTHSICDPTIEDEFHKSCVIDGKDYLIKVVDTANQEDYWVPNYQHVGVDGYLSVYSVRSRSTFEIAQKYRTLTAGNKVTESCPFILVGNQSDSYGSEREISFEEGSETAKRLGCTFIETSALNGNNVDEAFHQLVRDIMDSKKEPEKPTLSASNEESSTAGCAPRCVIS